MESRNKHLILFNFINQTYENIIGYEFYQAWWLMPVIQVTQKAETRKMFAQGQPRLKRSQDPFFNQYNACYPSHMGSSNRKMVV
jgi:hypothetical protein